MQRQIEHRHRWIVKRKGSDIWHYADDFNTEIVRAYSLANRTLSREETARDRFTNDCDGARWCVAFLKLPSRDQRNTDRGEVAGGNPVPIRRRLQVATLEFKRT